MHTNEPRELEGVELGYDPRDIDGPKIYKIVFYFFVFATVFFGGGAAFYIWRGGGLQFARDARKPDIVGPKVQGNIAAKVDIMEMRQTERREMETYGTNPDGTQRIPLDRAMAILAQRGLPEIKGDEKAISPGTTIQQNAIEPGEGQSDRLEGGPAAPSTPTTPATTPPVPQSGATGSTGGASMP